MFFVVIPPLLARVSQAFKALGPILLSLARPDRKGLDGLAGERRISALSAAPRRRRALVALRYPTDH